MPEQTQTLAITGHDALSLQALAYGALADLGWTIKYAGENILVAYTPRKWNKFDLEITITTGQDTLNITSKMIHGEAYDMMGRNKKHLTAFMSAFENIKAKTTKESLIEWTGKIELLKDDTLKEAEKEVEQAEEVDRVMHFSKSNMRLTYALIIINVLVFIIMVADGVDFLAPRAIDVLRWGGSLAALDFSGDWWRTFTSMFLHFGIVHLLFNMYALYMVGVYLEPMLGKTRYMVAYLCSGLLSGLVSVLWHKNDIIVSAGASGAIFGMYGVFLALLTTSIIPKAVRQSLLQSILIFVAYNVFYGLKPGSTVDNAAHLGGLVSGMAIGYLFYFTLKNPSEKKTQTTTSLIGLATILLLFGVFRNETISPVQVDYKTGEIIGLTAEPGSYNEKLQEFYAFEKIALAHEEDQQQRDARQLIKQYTDVSLPAWDNAEKKLLEMQAIATTAEENSEVERFKKYTVLRKEWTNLQIKYLQDNSEETLLKLNSTVEQINAMFPPEPVSQ
jgi:rhomboid protease GluP